jgi:quinol monooxygenase YgiN
MTHDLFDLLKCRTKRSGDGNICFDWFRSVEDPNLYVLVEAFRDEAAGKVQVESAHSKAAIAQLPKWLSDVPIFVHVEAPGNGWSRMKSNADWAAQLKPLAVSNSHEPSVNVRQCRLLALRVNRP